MAPSPPRYALHPVAAAARSSLALQPLLLAAVVGFALAFVAMRHSASPVSDARAAVEPRVPRADVAAAAAIDDPRAWLAPIMQRNVFDPEVAADPSTTWNATWDDDDDDEDDLDVPWLLLGTMVAIPDRFSSALLLEAGEDGMKRAVGIGDLLDDDLVVVEIAHDHVIVRDTDGREGIIDLAEWSELVTRAGAPEPSIRKVGKGIREVNDGAIRALYADTSAALEGVRTRQDRNPALGGVKLTRLVRSNTLYKLGIRRNDTIRSVNGQTVHSRADLVKALGTLDKPNSFTIDIVRKRKAYTLNYNVR